MLLLFIGIILTTSLHADELLPWEEAQLGCSLNEINNLSSVDNCPPRQSELVRLLCEKPKKFCRAVRRIEQERFSQEYNDSACRPYVYWNREQLSTEQGSREVSRILRSRVNTESLPNPDFEFVGHLEGVYQGQIWEDAKRQFSISRQVIIDYLQALTPPAPQVVIDTISNTKIMDPYDQSIPLETREEAFKNCGTNTDTLGHYNAFADSNGFVTVCPKMLLATNGTNLLSLFLHEISHTLGPCLLANQMLTFLTPPNCEPNQSEDPRVHQVGSWLLRMKNLEECFLDSGLNDGGEERWVSRQVRSMMENNDSNEEEENQCIMDADDFRISQDPLSGVAGYCDHSSVKASIFIARSLEGINITNRFAKFFNKLRVLNAQLRIAIPNANQFNEGHADWMAARLLPRARNLWNREHTPEDIASEISLLCATRHNPLMSGEAHPLDQRRMEIFSSQDELREMLGCEGRSRRFSRRIGRCGNE